MSVVTERCLPAETEALCIGEDGDTTETRIMNGEGNEME